MGAASVAHVLDLRARARKSAPALDVDSRPPWRRARRYAVYSRAASEAGGNIERLWKQLHDHVTRNHIHRSIKPLMEAVDEFIAGAQPFPGTNVSMLAQAA